jgi:hypothetical protein
MKDWKATMTAGQEQVEDKQTGLREEDGSTRTLGSVKQESVLLAMVEKVPCLKHILSTCLTTGKECCSWREV